MNIDLNSGKQFEKDELNEKNEKNEKNENFNKRPLIAITPSYDGGLERGKVKMSGEYLHAVWEAGGIPAFIPWTSRDDRERLAEYADCFDGFLFGGGVDLDPKYYGETMFHESVEICAERDEFELALFAEVIKRKKPIFGICRGIQLINVALGGSLYQHIEGHSQRLPVYECPQTVKVEKGSELFLTVGEETIMTNTFHHQAIKEVAPRLRISAISSDGFIEAVESRDISGGFILAVQWHPELFYRKDKRAAALFFRFVKECRKRILNK